MQRLISLDLGLSCYSSSKELFFFCYTFFYCNRIQQSPALNANYMPTITVAIIIYRLKELFRIHPCWPMLAMKSVASNSQQLELITFRLNFKKCKAPVIIRLIFYTLLTLLNRHYFS